MWIKDKVNDCYKMSHSHLITIEKKIETTPYIFEIKE